MSIKAFWERRDRRSLEWLAVSGVVLPLATIAVVRWAALTWELDLVPVAVALFALPLIAVALLVGSGPWEAGPLGRSPDTGPDRFRDQIPERYHEEFAVETLNETVEEDPGPSQFRVYAMLYCAMVPTLTIVVMIL